MTMNPVSRKIDDESQKLVDEFLAKGGKIQKFEYGQRTENIGYGGKSFYGKKNKKQDEQTDYEEKEN